MLDQDGPEPTLLHLLAGTITGTNLKLANDLAGALDTEDFRILPIVGKGTVQGARDLLDLTAIDAATLQSNVVDFETLKRERGDVGQRLAVIAKLFNEELHVLAPRSIETIDQLAGKRVNFGPSTSGGHATSRLIFEQLGIEVDMQERSQVEAPTALLAGEIDALCRVVGSPVEDFSAMIDDQGLHLLPITVDRIAGAYLEASFSNRLYPGLVAPDRPVATIAVASLLVCKDLSDDHPRMAALSSFVERLRRALPTLRGEGYHAKWAEAALDVALPGWKTFRGPGAC